MEHRGSKSGFFCSVCPRIYSYFSATVGSRNIKSLIKAFYRPLQRQISVDYLM